MLRHDLTGLELAIFLKSNLLRALAVSAPDEWPRQIEKFVVRLEASNLQDATALAVLLADLRAQLRIVANAIGATAGEAAIDEPALMTMSHDEVLAWFRAETLDITARVPSTVGARSRAVEQVVQFIHDHYAEPVTIDSIAQALGQSQRHVVTLFRREMGQTINEYLTHVRMCHGVELIRQGCKIEAVSLMVGYRSRKNFNRHFKAVLGMTPRTYKLTTIRQP